MPALIVIFYPVMSGTSPIVVIKKNFLLKFSKDRQRWRHWLFEAKKRFGLYN